MSAVVVCSFCEKDHTAVQKMVACTPDRAICDQCVVLAVDLCADGDSEEFLRDHTDGSVRVFIYGSVRPADIQAWRDGLRIEVERGRA